VKNSFGFGKKDTNKTAAPWVGRKSVDGRHQSTLPDQRKWPVPAARKAGDSFGANA
jgi:hypothetical protein